VVGQIVVGQIVVGQIVVRQIVVGQIVFGPIVVGKIVVGQILVKQNVVGQNVVEQKTRLCFCAVLSVNCAQQMNTFCSLAVQGYEGKKCSIIVVTQKMPSGRKL
jgi:hypothetical protein